MKSQTLSLNVNNVLQKLRRELLEGKIRKPTDGKSNYRVKVITKHERKIG